MRVVRIEATPNPDALKFYLEAPLPISGSRHYDEAGAAQGDELATALFALAEVESVFYMADFVTVTKKPDAEWRELRDRISGVIESASFTPQETTVKAATPEENELLQKIESVIDRQIRPALAGDGGGLEILGLDGYTLKIHYQGACGSCPSATAGTMHAIEQMLKLDVDQRIKVVADNAPAPRAATWF